MTAIVSGGSLGLLDSSLLRLGAQGQVGAASNGRAAESIFVNAATGNLYIQRQDEILVGRGLDASFLRTYNSQGLLNDDNGDNWRLGLYRRVYGLTGAVNTAGSTVLRVDADASEAVYNYDAALGKYVSTAGSGSYDTLSYDSGTQTWTWVDGDSRATETYDAANGGRLTSAADESGNVLGLAYGAGGLLAEAHTADGEVTYLDYSGTNLTDLRTVTSGGATLIRTRYAYDASNRLIQVKTDLSPEDGSVADGNVYTTTYAYDGASKRIASIAQSDGTAISFTYEQVAGQYWVKTYTDGLGRVTTLTYTQNLATVSANAGVLATTRTTTSTQSRGLASGALSTTDTQTTTQNYSLVTAALATGISVYLIPAGATWSSVANALYGTSTLSGTLQAALGNPPLTAGNYLVNLPATLTSTVTTTVTVAPYYVIPSGATWASIATALYGSAGVAGQLQAALGNPPLTAGNRLTGFPASLDETTSTTVTVAPYYTVQAGDTWASVTQAIYGTSEASAVAALRQALGDPALATGVELTVPSGIAYSVTQSANANSAVLSTSETQTTTTVRNLNSALLSEGTWSGASVLQTASTAGTAPVTGADQNGNVFAMYLEGSNVVIRRFNAAADAWSAATTLGTSTPFSWSPQLYVDALGNAIAAWSSSSGPAVVRYSAATGSWSAPEIVTGGTNYSVAIGANGDAVVLYSATNFLADVWARRYTNGQWSAAQQLFSQSSGAGHLSYRASVDADGSIQVLASEFNMPAGGDPTPGSPKVYAVRYILGSGWTAPTLLVSGSSTISTTVSGGPDSAGNELVVWKTASQTSLSFSRYTKSSNTWTAGGTIPWPGGTIYSVQACVDASGNAIATWTGLVGSTTSIWVSRYTAATQTWSTAQSLGNASTQSGYSVAALNSRGQAVVVWYAAPNFTAQDLYASRYINGAWQAAELLETNVNPVAAPQLTLDQSGNVEVVWQQSDGTANRIYVNRARPNYVIPSGATWPSIAQGLYGSSAVAAQLQAALGNPTLVAGNRLSGLPLSLAEIVTTSVTVAPYYTVQSGDTWTSITQTVYATSNAAAVSALQAALGNPALTVGAHLTMPATLAYTTTLNASANAAVLSTTKTTVSTQVHPVASSALSTTDTVTTTQSRALDGAALTALSGYVVPSGATWASVAQALYGSAGVAGALQAALGNPALGAGSVLLGLPPMLSATVTSTVTVAPYYVIPSGATWASIATALYGSAGVAGQLQAALGNPPLTAGNRLTGFPASLDETISTTVTVAPYYTVQAGDTWASVTQAIYGTSHANAVAALRATLGDPALTPGTELTVPATLTYSTATTAALISARTDISDPLGQVTSYFADDSGNLTRVLSAAVNGQRLETLYSYDAAGNVTGIVDARGNSAAMEYDTRGNLVLTRDAQGNTVSRTYGAANQLLAQTFYQVADPDGAGAAQPAGPLTTRYVYDSSTRLRFAVSAEGNVTEYRYDGFGQRVASIQYAAQRYDVSALAPSATLTEAQLTAWLPADRSASTRVDTAYDFRGQVASETTYTAVDAAGNGIANGTKAKKQYIYDQAGNLLQTIDARTPVTIYDETGYLIVDPGIRVANAYVTSFVYDGLGRVLTTTDSLDRVTLNQYDDANRKTTVTLANGLVRTATYSAAGELVSVLESANSQALGETKYFYDADGRLRRTEDPTGVRTHILYDAAGRKIAAIDGDGSLTEYLYNADGAVTKTIRYATAVSATNLANLVDAAGRPTNVGLAAIRPAAAATDRSTWNAYDDADRLVKSVDELGFVTQNVYDGVGRVIGTVRYFTAIDTALLGDAPAPGDIVPVSNAADRVTRAFYDSDGRLRGTLDGEGFLVEYRYDAAGQLVETVGYATATNASQRANGTLAQLIPAADAADVHSYRFYNARGQLAQTIDAEDYRTDYVYDAAGNRTQETRYATKVAINTPPASSPQDRVASYTYDALNRIVSQTNPEGTLTQYTYDEAGNLTKTVKAFNTADVRTLTAQYDKQGRLTAELSAIGAAQLTGSQTQAQIDAIWAANSIKHAYDLGGRRTSTTDANGNKILFFYNADGALTHTINALGEVKESVYNALGQLTQTIQYGTRLSAATLASLSGGLVNSTLTNAIAASQNVALDTRTSLAYTKTGALQQTTDALGNTVTQAYNAFGEAVSRSQALGGGQSLDHTYSYDHRGLLLDTVWDPSGLNTSTSTVYDAFGRAIQTTDARGNVRRQSYDRLGHVVTTTDPLNQTRTAAYDAFDRVLTQTDTLGKTTTYSYDTANRSVTVTTAEGIVTTAIRNRFGETQSVTDGRGNTTTYVYDKNGNLRTITDALGKTTTSSYDNADLRIETVDANGNRTSYSYDAANRMLTRSVDPTGLNLTTRYEYDAKSQTIRVTDPSGAVTETEYDNKGEIKAVIVDPAGLNLRTEYVHDGRGLTLTVIEGAGRPEARTTQYVYDKLGRRTEEHIDPAGLNLTTAYAYDKNDNVVAKIEAPGRPETRTARYVYDANDRLICTVDALGGTTQNTYNAAGNLVQRTRYANAISTGAMPLAAAASDITARLIPDSRDQVTKYTYDNDQRLIFTVDSLGGVTENSYDSNNNVIQQISYASAIPAATAATVSAVRAALIANVNQDHVRATIYDAADRAVFSRDPLGNITENVYAADGNVTRQIHYANAIDPATVNTLSAIRTALIPSDRDQSTRIVYDRAGRQIFTIDALGYVKEIQYDGAGRIKTTLVYANPVSLSASAPTPADVRAAIETAPANQRSAFAYDNAGRLTSTTDALSQTETYSYDALGNKKTFTNKKGDTWTYAYDRTGRLETTTQPAETAAPGVVTRYVYDALGNRTDIIEAQGLAEERTTHTVYDVLGRLTEQTTAFGKPEASTNRFSFDIFGNETAYVDSRGVELAERDTEWASAERLRLGYAITGTGGPRAKLASELNATEQASLRVLYTTTQIFDRLNRKLSATDALGNTTRTVYDAFGNIGTAVDPNGNAGYFYYDALNRITFQIDPEGDASETRYDFLGKAVATIKYANKAQGAYDQTTRPQLLTVAPATTPSGPYLVLDGVKDQLTLAEHDTLGRNTKITDAEGYVESFTYDANGNVTTHIDKNGNLCSYDYDANGNKIAEVLPIGAGNSVPVVNRYEYDALGNKTRSIEAAGLTEQRITQFVYDKNSRLIETIAPQVLVTTSVLGTAGSLALSAGNVNYQLEFGGFIFLPFSTLTMSWPPIIGYDGGNLRIERTTRFDSGIGTSTSVFSLASGSTSFTDTIQGGNITGTPSTIAVRLYKQTALGDILISEWIPPGQNSSESKPLKTILNFAGQPANGRTLRVAYWPSADPNNITELDLPSYTSGSFSVMAPTVLAGDYAYKAKVFDAQGEVLNQMTGTFSIVNGATSSAIQGVPLLRGQLQTPHTFKAYDARGNLTAETDAKGNRTNYYYDTNNRKIATVDAERYLHRYVLDAAGNMIAQRTYADRIPDSVALTTLPDPAAIAGMNPANYREMRYRYDANNRAIEARTQDILTYDRTNGLRTAAIVSQRQYDRNGNLVLTIDGNGNRTFYFYDKRGKKLAEVSALGYLTAWQYDANGNITREAKYATALSAATRSTLSVTNNAAALEAEAVSTANADNRITVYAYDRMNRKTAETLLGLTYSEFVSATSGQLAPDRIADVATRYEYDGEGHTTAMVADTARTDYAYDARGRRISERDPAFTDHTGATVRSLTETAYDGVGNIVSVTRRGAVATDVQTTRYEYDPFGNRTREIDPLNSPITYFYDLNGNITVKHERRTNPDGTQPAIDTVYTYDKLNRQATTRDFENFTYSATYDAFGEIVKKGLNGLDKEFYEYDNAGRLIKTNKDDGVYRGYLYDANGNETAKIQSSIQDIDLSLLAINQIATLDPAIVQRVDSEYDANDQLVRTYQAPTQSTTDNVSIQHVLVDALNDPFTGGTLTPAAGGTVNYQLAASITEVGINRFLFRSTLTLSWPPIIGYGSSNLRVEWGTARGPRVSFLGAGTTSFTDTFGLVLGPAPGVIPTTYVRIYKETAFGDILISDWIPPPQTTPATLSPSESKPLKSLLHFTGQRTEASTLQIRLRPVGAATWSAPVSAPKMATASGATVAGWFVFDWSAFAAGNYEYEFQTFDTAGKELDHVRGTLTLGSNPTVNSKLIDTIQPVLTPGSTSNNVIARAQSYDAFGDVLAEIDGRGYVLTTSNEAWAQAERQRLGFAALVSSLTETDKQRLVDIYTTTFTYDKRGQLVRKTDPETSATADTGAVSRLRPTTQYYYDVLGRNIGVRDPNQSLTASPIINTQRYDAAGDLVAEYHADGGVKSYGYDSFGNRRFQIDEIAARTNYTYDAKNQLKRVDRPTDASFGNVARFELYDYDDAGRRIKHTDALGFSELTYYDDIGRVKKTVTSGGVVTSYRYIYDAASGGTTVITTLGDDRTLKDQKDYFGRLLHHDDLGGHAFDYTYNKAGWLIHQSGDTNLSIAGNEQSIDFSYYQNGYLKDVVDNALNTKTRYEYDANGNRIFEGIYQVTGNVYYQWSRARYDELNRVTTVSDPKYDITYEYDVNGNRRHIFARYHDGLQGSVQVQDYWYAYDAMNRFVVTKGTLADALNNPIDVNANPAARGSGHIVAGSQGYAISYDAASQRRAANNERYDYNVGGLLTTTQIDNALRAQRNYDAAGNVTQYLEKDGAGTVTRNYQYTYNGDHEIKTENNGSITSTYTYDRAGNLTEIFSPQVGGTTSVTTYAYEYWDTAKQKEIKIQASNGQAPNWAPGFSRFTYDVNGHLTQVSDVVANRHLSYKLDTDGRILQRNELVGITSSRTQNYYYLNGIGIGDAGGFGSSQMDYATVLANRGQETKTRKPVASADFDYNYQPINDTYPTPTPGTYILQQGQVAGSVDQTLRNVALAVWGDSSLWYLIADANGLTTNATLTAGQILVIPNVVTNIHNNSTTFKPYNPGGLIGDTTPTLPDPPPPPTRHVDRFFQTLSIIVIVAIAIMVSYATEGVLSEYMAAWAAAAIGAMAGSAAAQVAAKELKLRDHFSWKEVAIAGITAGLTNGIDTGYAAADAVLKEAVAQGLRIATNQQEKFNWAALAAAPINGYIDGENADTSNATSKTGATTEGFETDLFKGIAKGAVSEGVAILVNHGGRINWTNIATNALTSAIANAAGADKRAEARERQLQWQEDLRDRAIWNASGGGDAGGSVAQPPPGGQPQYGTNDGSPGPAQEKPSVATMPPAQAESPSAGQWITAGRGSTLWGMAGADNVTFGAMILANGLGGNPNSVSEGRDYFKPNRGEYDREEAIKAANDFWKAKARAKEDASAIEAAAIESGQVAHISRAREAIDRAAQDYRETRGQLSIGASYARIAREEYWDYDGYDKTIALKEFNDYHQMLSPKQQLLRADGRNAAFAVREAAAIARDQQLDALGGEYANRSVFPAEFQTRGDVGAAFAISTARSLDSAAGRRLGIDDAIPTVVRGTEGTTDVASIKNTGPSLGFGEHDLVLGLNKNGVLKDWAKANGGKIYQDLDLDGPFVEQIHVAMKQAPAIRFNLDNVDVRQANGMVTPFGDPAGGYTNFELYQLKTVPEYHNKTTFYKDGVKYEGNPFK